MKKNASIKWKSFGLTDVGAIRDHNEDAFMSLPDQSFWIVADGMGGHQSGELASSMIVEQFRNFHAYSLFGLNINWITKKLQAINNDLLALAKESRTAVIGSTVAILFAQQRYCACVWVGDSRIYRYRDGSLKCLTRDHSQQQELQDMGYSLEEIEQFPDTQGITRAIGADDFLQVEVRVQEIKPNDIFLLCSDGLYKELSDHEIAEILGIYSLERSLDEMLLQCLRRAAGDNVTIVGVHYPS